MKSVEIFHADALHRFARKDKLVSMDNSGGF